MRTNYFIHKGKRYAYGTIIRVKHGKGERLETFVACDPEKNYYRFKFDNNNCRDGYMYITYTKERLNEYLIEITNKIDTKFVEWHPINPPYKPTFKDELEIDGMFIAWLWYIVLIAVTLIFNGFYFYWALISFGFFIYRYGKLKEEGYK